RVDQAEALCPVPAVFLGRLHVVKVSAELDEQVENARRHGPTEGAEASEFRTGIVRHEEGVVSNRERRDGAKLAPPEFNRTTRPKLTRHHAHGFGPLAGPGDEFKIRRPNLPELIEHSDKSAQAADRDMIHVPDYSVLAESNLKQVHEREVRPFGLRGHI